MVKSCDYGQGRHACDAAWTGADRSHNYNIAGSALELSSSLEPGARLSRMHELTIA